MWRMQAACTHTSLYPTLLSCACSYADFKPPPLRDEQRFVPYLVFYTYLITCIHRSTCSEKRVQSRTSAMLMRCLQNYASISPLRRPLCILLIAAKKQRACNICDSRTGLRKIVRAKLNMQIWIWSGMKRWDKDEALHQSKFILDK